MKRADDFAFHVLIFLRFLVRHRGKENAVTAEQIENALGFDPRHTADLAAFVGRQGFAVCSGATGYHYAANEKEWSEHLEKERNRALVVLERVEESRKNHVDQITLFETKPAA